MTRNFIAAAVAALVLATPALALAQAPAPASSSSTYSDTKPRTVSHKTHAKKGSKSKKTDDIESYVYRNDAGEICLPGEYLRQAIILAAKYRQDPRSPRKSAMDLYKAGVVSLTPLASLGKDRWDYEDKRRRQA